MERISNYTTKRGDVLTITNNCSRYQKLVLHTSDNQGGEALLLNGVVMTASKRYKKLIEQAYKEYQQSIK